LYTPTLHDRIYFGNPCKYNSAFTSIFLSSLQRASYINQHNWRTRKGVFRFVFRSSVDTKKRSSSGPVNKRRRATQDRRDRGHLPNFDLPIVHLHRRCTPVAPTAYGTVAIELVQTKHRYLAAGRRARSGVYSAFVTFLSTTSYEYQAACAIGQRAYPPLVENELHETRIETGKNCLTSNLSSTRNVRLVS